jgi:crotonobetainyl-CoA:carnitine CoA-transferase CaiB-like acyl-CoA transferase
VPCGPINSIGEGVQLAERLGLQPLVDLAGSLQAIRNPISFSESELRYDLPPPALGADSDEIRRWLKS